jgi:hypothetical protein
MLLLAATVGRTAAPGSTDPVHWAFTPVERPSVPAAPDRSSGISNPIDAFVAAKLAEKNLQHSAEASRPMLIRRLYFVMLGVPPAPEQIDDFVRDPRPGAFERLVERVLDDPRYGERWGRHWLDVVRFAESNGFETNRERPNAWRFRDYVIAAFNADKPYDQFIREQLAGDALGTDVATGFLVGGAVDIVTSPDPTLTAQQRADELDDMVSTTGTAFMGLTLGCARCHSHKFDPISHQEYYSMSALLAGVRHGERPLPVESSRQVEIGQLERRIATLETNLAPFLADIATTQATNAGPRAKRPSVNFLRNEEIFPATEARYIRFTITAASGAEPCIDELEVWSGEQNVALASLGTRATASGTLPGYEIHKLEHINDGQTGNGHSWISNEPGRGWVQLELRQSQRIDRIVWGRDREGRFADRLPTGYRLEAALETNSWVLLASSKDREPFKGKGAEVANPLYKFEGRSAREAEQGREWLAELGKTRAERDRLAKPTMVYAGQFVQPGTTFRLHRGDPMQRRESVAPGTLGLFEPITLATNATERERRLALANWIASPRNPLTARVLVNRVWQHHFGIGLVDTPNDFGLNGARPTNPPLLDWLASELVNPIIPDNSADLPRSHAGVPWSIKHLHRLILTSQTWRQSSVPSARALEIDANSRLLWRFPPRRLEAEAIRDSILTVSGTLNPATGGPGFFLHDVDRENVYHYHPKEDFGTNELRRMIYAFKVRMEQDGIFGAFDCPDGSLVMPRRSVSTTPLQALNLFNSRFVLQQSEKFAERLQHETGSDGTAAVRRAWQLAFGRKPSGAESKDAVDFAQKEGWPALCRAILNANEFLFVP